MRILPRAERFALLDRRAQRRTALALLLGGACAALAVAMAVKEAEAPDAAADHPVIQRPADPLAAEFARCQALGEAGARDPQCLAAWADNRRRFLMPDHRVLGINPAPPPQGVR